MIYHMMLLLFSGLCHVINNVMTTCYITLSEGTSNVMKTSITTMHIFIEINFEGDKITFKMSYDKQNLYARDFILNLLNSPKAHLINFI